MNTMKTTNCSLGVTLGCVILFGAIGVFAQDWPQWRGPDRDGKVSGFKAPQKWPAALTQKWKTTVGFSDSTPALVGDKLYVFARQGDDEAIVCLNAADGKGVWTNNYAAAAISGPDASAHPGPRSSPVVANGKVVTLGINGVLSCVDAATGKTLWRKDEFPGVTPRFHTAMSPIVVDGLAIAHLGGSGNGALIAYDLATGDQKWKWAEEGPAFASPVLMTVGGVKQIVTLTEKSVVGVAVADGKGLWKLPFAVTGMNYNAATPIVDGQTVIYTGAGRGAKAVKIEKQGDAFAATELWSNAELSPQFTTPVLKNGLLFGLTSRGNLYCLNAKDGKSAWTDSTVQDRSGFGSVLDGGSVVLALPGNSQLIAFTPSDKQYEEVAKIKVADTPTYATPLVTGNRIFVKDRDAVTLWTID